MDKLSGNSMVFSNFFATGDRSDKGIVGIFSGFPAQPTTSIINYPSKTQSLPFLLKSFHETGYHTSFYYGGNINFANFRSYLTNSSLDRIVTSDDFPPAENIQKWGVPDEFLFRKILTDIDTIRGRFFISCFTLSSHDPYDFPGKFFFGNKNFDEKSKSGFYYTDHCIGEFIAQAKTKSWWDNTLIIIISDHGSRSPYQVPNHVRAKFQIPMIWAGGSILTRNEITKYCSQTDLPVTILRQFGLNSDGYKYSNDIFDPSTPSFAFYFFNHGFGFMSDSVSLIYDHNLHDFINREGMDTAFYEKASMAYLQMLSNDFHTR
jgi:phosphoglycerol transferase MdoB-like AlkP superfamily enzyme